MKREEFERYLRQARHTLESAEKDARFHLDCARRIFEFVLCQLGHEL